MRNSFLPALLSLVSIPIVAVGVFAQDLPEVPPPPPPPVNESTTTFMATPYPTKEAIPGATVRGRLVYEDTGAPIRFAEIGLSPTESLGSYRESGKTDENGIFIITDVMPGQYYPVVENRGILNPEVFYFPSDSDDERKARMRANFQMLSIQGSGDQEIFVRARRGASISGIVRYPDGEPAVRVKVEALSSSRGLPSRVGLSGPGGPGVKETDDQGFYRFTGLPEGIYYIRITEQIPHTIGTRNYNTEVRNISGEEPFQTWFPGSPTSGNASMVEAFYGEATEGINITLPERKLYDVSGVVVRKKTGEPLKNFRITAHPLVDQVQGELTAATVTRLMAPRRSSFINPETEEIPSEWSIINLPKGKYLLTASPQQINSDGNSSESEAGLSKPNFPAVSREIELTDGDHENEVFEIPEGGRISGIVSAENGEKLPEYMSFAAVNSETKEIEMFSAEITDLGEDESAANQQPAEFEMGPVQAGRYELEYTGRDFYVRSVANRGAVAEGNAIEIGDGNILSNVRIVLASDLATIKGSITKFDPESQTTVMLLREGQDILVAIAKGPATGSAVMPDGTFEFRAPPGKYSVVVASRKNAPLAPLELVGWFNRLRKNAPIIDVSAKEVVSLELPMPE